MELRVLRYFLAVAREGSVTGAANALHVTQPTLSRQIRELEEKLGARLLVRRSHSVTLTAEGIRFRQRAEEILDMVEKAEAEFGSVGEAIGGDVYIGGGETRAMGLIAEIIKGIRKEYPGIRFRFHSGNATDVTERLDRGLLDFGVLIQPVDLGKYEHVELPARDAWGVLMRKDNPLARKKSVRRKDLLNMPLIYSRWAMRRGAARNPFADWLGGGEENLNVVATYNLIYIATIMVEQGIGCAIAIDGLANIINTGQLCFRRLDPKLESGLNVVWKKHQVFSPAAQIFLERIQEKFGRTTV